MGKRINFLDYFLIIGYHKTMRILKVCAKCSDMFSAELITDGERHPLYEGYVPYFFPGNHFGNYVILDIDIDTGVIVNWKKPSEKDLQSLK